MKREILKNFLLDSIFPIECLACGIEGQWLCQKCFDKTPIKEFDWCAFCKKNYKTTLGRVCPDCQRDISLNGILSAGDYRHPLYQVLILNLKYQFAEGICAPLARLILKRMAKSSFFDQISGETILVPIPLHKKRLAWRGFNQAKLIAQYLSDKTGWPVEDIITRNTYRQPQAEIKSKEARAENTKGIFKFNFSADIFEKNILLIDDVATTGATLNEAAIILEAHHPKSIWGVTAAHD